MTSFSSLPSHTDIKGSLRHCIKGSDLNMTTDIKASKATVSASYKALFARLTSN